MSAIIFFTIFLQLFCGIGNSENKIFFKQVP